MSLEKEYEIAKERAGGRCEWEEGNKYNMQRCDEVHGEPAKHYKGKCILLPNFTRIKGVRAEDIKYLCFHHSVKTDLQKKKRAPVAPKTNPLQVRLFA